MSEPLSGIPLRLAVAEVLGQTEPPEFYNYPWVHVDDGSWECEIRDLTGLVARHRWPLAYDIDTNLTLEAWRKVTENRPMAQLHLEVTSHGTRAVIVDEAAYVIPWIQASTVATGICRALVAWRERKEAR